MDEKHEENSDQADPQGSQNIRAAALGGGGAIAVLGHAHTGRRANQCHRRGNVERAQPVAARAAALALGGGSGSPARPIVSGEGVYSSLHAVQLTRISAWPTIARSDDATRNGSIPMSTRRVTALAERLARMPLLYVGQDFSKTDIESA